jgi:AcrR family transcriptional regulator
MPKPKMDRRVVRSKRMLREALVSLMAEKGYDAVTVLEIAERADLNRATFYLHYSDKEDLLQQSLEEVLNEVMQGIEELNLNFIYSYSESPDPNVIKLFERIADHAFFFQVMLTKADRQCTERLQNYFRTWVGRNMDRVPADEEQFLVPKNVIIHYMSSAMVGLIV